MQNTNTAADSNARLLLASADLANGADVFVHFATSGTAFSLGTDGSADIFKLTTGATPSSGTELLAITTVGVMTVGGSITATSGSLRADGASGTAVAFIEMDDGATVGVGATGEVRFRSNAGVFEVSENGGAFATLGGGNTLDGAYDQGGAAAGRTINVDASSPVLLSGGGTPPSNAVDVLLHLHDSTSTGANAELTISSGTSGAVRINMGDSADEDICFWAYENSLNRLFLFVNGVEMFNSDSSVVVFNSQSGDRDLRRAGDTLSHQFFCEGNAASENIALLTTAVPNWQSMDRGYFIGDVTTAPTGNPTAGVFVYVTAGAAQVRGGGGTVTEWGPSALHCEVCGSDFWTAASMNMNWKSWCFICGVCGATYKGGPQNVLDQLTPQQNTELIRQTSTWEDVKKLMQLVA